MSHFTGLRCRMCGETYPATALYVCSECLGICREILNSRAT